MITAPADAAGPWRCRAPRSLQRHTCLINIELYLNEYRNNIYLII